MAAESVPFDFNCGYVGYFGYEMKAESGVCATMTREQLAAQMAHVRAMHSTSHNEDNEEGMIFYAFCAYYRVND